MVRNVSGTIVDAKTAEEQTLAAQQEIEQISGSSHNFQYQTMTVERDGKIIEIEVPIDDIDLIKDYDDDDMSEEGLRSVGVLPEEYNSLYILFKNFLFCIVAMFITALPLLLIYNYIFLV